MNSISRNLVVTCPRCGNKANYSSENPWRPFCSERCKLIDLGKWASEEFKVPAESHSEGQIQSDDDSNVHENDEED